MSNAPAEATTGLDIARSLRAVLGQLPAAERAVARELLRNYPVAGLQTVAQLAEKANVSAPSVLRLVNRLGFPTYGDFQSQLHTVIEGRLSSQRKNFTERVLQEDPRTLTDRAEAIYTGVRLSLLELSEAQRGEMGDLLSSPTARLFIIGGAVAGIPASYLARNLQLVRPNVVEVPGERWAQSRALLDIGKGDVVIAYDFRRYQRETVEFGLVAAKRGAKLVVITDPWMSPLVKRADIVICLAREASDLLTPVPAAMALTELLLGDAIHSIGADSLDRLATHDELVHDHVVRTGGGTMRSTFPELFGDSDNPNAE